MKKVKIIVDWDGENYGACPANEDIACVVAAKSLDELKADMEEALRQHIEWMKEDGDAFPEEFCGEWAPEWCFTNRARLHYSGALS